jgi:hypothetical protein
MSQVISAIYEGNGLVRLEQEPEGIKPQQRLSLFVVPQPAHKQLSVEKVGLEELRQQLEAFETRYALKTPEFYTRFLRGEMGDQRDFIVWAGLHELLQRMTARA